MKLIEALTVSDTDIVVKAHDDMEPLVVLDVPVASEKPSLHDDMLVVEDETPQLEMLPGSDMAMDLQSPSKEPEHKEIAKVTNWADDKDFSKFLDHMEKELKNIPYHTGKTMLGCERAINFLKQKQSEITKAIREDLKGEIDESQADRLYSKIEKDIDKLERHKSTLTKKAAIEVNMFSEAICEKCNTNSPMWHNVPEDKLVCMACDAEKAPEKVLTKEAGTPKLNVYVSAFERAVVGILINGAVSSGKNIEELYNHLKNKYNFNPREELAIQQLVEDHGYPVFKDRGLINEDSNPQSENGMDWMPNYYA